MSYASETSASDSGKTRQTSPSTKEKSTPDIKREMRKELSEADFLKAQQANAKAAIVRTLGEIKDSVAQGVDARNLVYHHPWLSSAGAAVTGFVAAAVAVPSREQSALKRLAKWEKALHHAEGRRAPEDDQAASDGKPKVKQEKQGFFAHVAGELVKSVGPALASALTAGMTTQGAARAAENGHDGADTSASENVQ
jgi:hypothetical protein